MVPSALQLKVWKRNPADGSYSQLINCWIISQKGTITKHAMEAEPDDVTFVKKEDIYAHSEYSINSHRPSWIRVTCPWKYRNKLSWFLFLFQFFVLQCLFYLFPQISLYHAYGPSSGWQSNTRCSWPLYKVHLS